jgi:DNA-binding CsgD family transcriptional regulator
MNQLLKSDTLDNGMAGLGRARLQRKHAANQDQWPRCSPELVDILLMLRHPAWVESAEGELLFFNKSRLGRAVLKQQALANISRQTPSGLSASGKISAEPRAAAFAAVAFPVICGMAGNLRIVVACCPGDESARDKELTQTLWGKLLKFETDRVSDPRLSPQQLLIWRLLRRGLSYKEMAGALGVAHPTIRVQVAAIRKILGVGKVPVLRRGGGKRALRLCDANQSE